MSWHLRWILILILRHMDASLRLINNTRPDARLLLMSLLSLMFKCVITGHHTIDQVCICTNFVARFGLSPTLITSKSIHISKQSPNTLLAQTAASCEPGNGPF